MNKVVASLKYGRIWRKWIIFWWGMFLYGLFFMAYGIVFILEKNIIGILGTLLCFSIFSGIALYMIIKNHINVLKCKEWMQDAIELYADTRGIKKPLPGITDIMVRKLEVIFQFSGKKYVFQSGTKKSNGYDRFFSRFVDKKIRILYSPKFNEVMLLDDQI